MDKMQQGYLEAVEIAIEEAELGLSWTTWDNCPFADIRYGLSDQTGPDLEETQEAAQMFGDDQVQDSDVWLKGLEQRDFEIAKRAIDDLRAILARAQQPLPMPALLGWIDI